MATKARAGLHSSQETGALPGHPPKVQATHPALLLQAYQKGAGPDMESSGCELKTKRDSCAAGGGFIHYATTPPLFPLFVLTT